MKKITFLKHYPIFVEQDQDGFFIVSCPLFAGCHSYGETIDDALQNIQEAILLWKKNNKNQHKKSTPLLVGEI